MKNDRTVGPEARNRECHRLEVEPRDEERKSMAAGDITFIECPYGDSFPVRKTATISAGTQQVVCPRCGHGFDVVLPESVERLSQEARSRDLVIR
jgi:transposase-like protein